LTVLGQRPAKKRPTQWVVEEHDIAAVTSEDPRLAAQVFSRAENIQMANDANHRQRISP
jgi:hypothetical protein